uniref:L1 transposable element RRM domain-containing protein n=1 Tax=Pundamilia nyererei TaxID=303518 RepID=A0A3B4F0H5_9CICH
MLLHNFLVSRVYGHPLVIRLSFSKIQTHYTPSIHPSICFRLSFFRVTGGAGAYPSCLRVKGVHGRQSVPGPYNNTYRGKTQQSITSKHFGGSAKENSLLTGRNLWQNQAQGGAGPSVVKEEGRQDKRQAVEETIQDVKRDVQDFSVRMDGAEMRISSVEDAVNPEKGKTDALVKQVALLTNKLEDLENRSRRSNLRLVNVPEKIEGNDAVAFLEKWLPEVLGPATFPRQPLIERAHRLPGRTQPNRPPSPRVLIVKFLNFQDKVRVMRAAMDKGKVICGGQEVMFFPDLSTDLHRRRRGFDRVKQQLRAMNVRYGLIYPARLRVSSGGHMHVFETPADAEKFIRERTSRLSNGNCRILHYLPITTVV